MQITTTKEILSPALALVSGAADTRGIIPALANVLMKATEGGNLSMICSDTGVLARSVSSVEVKKGGEVACDVSRLHALIKAIPEKQPIELSIEDGKPILLVKSGRSRFRLPTIPADTYPRLNPAKEDRVAVTMSARRLAEMIGDVASSMADADLRPFLNGALFSLDSKGLRLVSTDGFRLSITNEVIPGSESLVPRNVIVPRKTVLLAKKLLGQGGNVTLTLGATNLQMQFEDGSVLFGNGIDGKYPNFEAVVPTTANRSTVSIDRIANALTMLSAAPESKEVPAAMRNKMELTFGKNAMVLQRGEDGLCEIESECSDNTKAEFAFNIHYLSDAVATIRAHSEEAEIGFSDQATGAITLRPKGAAFPLCVVMPMRG